MAGAGGEQQRERFSSMWGTFFATAGVAIGLGNIWRFPYMMGEYGGVLFLVVYLLFMAAFGIPALMAEWSLGRYTRSGPSAAFGRVGLPGGRYFSYLLLLTVVMAASYYGVVVGWVLYFAVAFGSFGQLSTDFETLHGSLATQSVFVVVAIVIGCLALLSGVRKGIERASKIALPLFFFLFAVLIWRVLSLEHAAEGLREFVVPRWENFTGATPFAALGQAIFSLGLGGTFMVTYGSYMRWDHDIPRTAVMTAGADMAAALMAGLVVVPAAFEFDIELRAGPGLMFEAMPQAFVHMPFGNLLGAVFFGSIFLVAILSLIAAYETLVVPLTDVLGWSRAKSLGVIMVAMILLAVPAMLSLTYIQYSDLIWGTTMQPVGGALAVVALAWCLGKVRAMDELRRNSRLAIPNWLFYWIKYGIPLGILLTLVYGWISLE